MLDDSDSWDQDQMTSPPDDKTNSSTFTRNYFYPCLSPNVEKKNKEKKILLSFQNFIQNHSRGQKLRLSHSGLLLSNYWVAVF